MRRENCPQEGGVFNAVRTGTWGEDLSTHAAACAVCREIVEVSRWMKTLAESPEGTDPLPDAGLVWRRSQLSEKQAEAERAQNILDWAEFTFGAVVCAALAGWIGWNWDAIQGRLTSLWANAWQGLWAAGPSAFGAMPVLSSSSIVILSLAAIVLAYPLLVRD